MPSFIELCQTREELDQEAAVLRASLVEHIAFENPADDGAPTYFVGIQNEQVVSHLGRMPTQFCFGGRIEHASYFHDLYVHPDIRKHGGQGFFLSMNMYKEAERASPGFVALIWTNEINIALQKARKYDQLWTNRYTKVLSLDSKLDQLLPATVALPIKPACRWFLRVIDKAQSMFLRPGLTIETIKKFDSRFDKLAESLAESNGVAPFKNCEYLIWKYVTRPDLAVTIITASGRQSELLGFAVIVDPDPTYQTAVIAELAATNNDANVIKQLLASVFELSRIKNAERLAVVATDKRYSDILRSRLFVARGPQDPLFIALAEKSEEPELVLNADRWHMSLGDSEGPF